MTCHWVAMLSSGGQRLLAATFLVASMVGAAQTPGGRGAAFPAPPDPGPYVLPIPSFLDGPSGSLYKTASPMEFSGVVRPTSIPMERSIEADAALSMSSGYDTAVSDIPNAGGEVLFGEGYFGLHSHGQGVDLLLQQDSQFLKSYGTGIGVSHYQRTTASFIPTRYERTMWSVLLENGYGSDSARAIGSIAPSSFEDSPVPNANSTEYGFVTGDTLTDHVVVGVQHALTPVRSLNLQLSSYYHHFFDLRTSDQQYSFSAAVEQRFSRTQAFGIQAEGVQEHYSTLDCTTGSLNLTSRTQISENTKLEGRIGPIVGSAPTCAGTFDYNISLTSKTPRGNAFYIGSARAPTNGFILDAAWEEFTYGGFSHGDSLRWNLRTDAGYSRFLLANPTPSNPNQHGYFVSGELHRRLSGLTELSVNARFFYRNTGTAPNLTRAIAFVTYQWSREQRPTRFDTSGVR